MEPIRPAGVDRLLYLFEGLNLGWKEKMSNFPIKFSNEKRIEV